MTPRHAVLAVGAVLVLGMGVYLFVQVRATPAEAQSHTAPPTRTAEAAPPSAPAPPPPPTDGHGRATMIGQMKSAVSNGVERPSIAAGTEAPEAGSDEQANPKLDAILEQANKAYDRQDFDEARAIAGKVLSKQPNNIRMLRIMVSSACIEGDGAVAQKYYEQLPKGDRDQMRTRCDRYGVTFKEPAQ